MHFHFFYKNNSKQIEEINFIALSFGVLKMLKLSSKSLNLFLMIKIYFKIYNNVKSQFCIFQEYK